MRTPTGRSQFEKLVNHSAEIQTVINTMDAKTNKAGKPVSGRARRGTNLATGEVERGIIVLYQKNIDLLASQNEISSDEQLASTTGHEIEHFSEDNLQYEEGDSDAEVEPTKVGAAIVDEFKNQQPLVTTNYLDVVSEVLNKQYMD